MNGPDGNRVSGDRCRCSPLKGCGEWFNSTYAFDTHRTGTHGVDRRCLSPPEMLAAGMAQNRAGFWISRRMAILDGGKRETAAIDPHPIPGEGSV